MPEDSFISGQQNSTDPEQSISAQQFPSTELIILILSGIFGLLFLIWVYYEIRFQLLQRFYKNCLNEVIDAPPNLNPSYEGKLIFLVGKIQLPSPFYLSDPVLPFFEMTGSVFLKRHVEMLQWCKNKRNDFEKRWSAKPIKTSEKQYENPIWYEQLRDDIFLDESDVNVIPFKLCKEAVKMLPVSRSLNTVSTFLTEQIEGYKVTADSSYYYLRKFDGKSGIESTDPEVGDYRIRYYVSEVGTYVTILGEYRDGMIEKYKGKLLFVDAGFVSVNTIFERYTSEASFKQNQIRALGVLGLVVGVILAASIF